MENTKYSPLDVNDIMPFGKYKGILMKKIAENDFKYMDWLDNKSSASITEELRNIYIDALNEYEDAKGDAYEYADGYYGLSHSDVIEAGGFFD